MIKFVELHNQVELYRFRDFKGSAEFHFTISNRDVVCTDFQLLRIGANIVKNKPPNIDAIIAEGRKGGFLRGRGS